MKDITKVKVPGPRKLKPCGSGGLLNEQQYCFDMGHKEGVAKARKAIREAIAADEKTKSAFNLLNHMAAVCKGGGGFESDIRMFMRRALEWQEKYDYHE